jgi:hypothetical protein
MFICRTAFRSVLGHVMPNIQLLMGNELSLHETNQKFSPAAKLEKLGSLPLWCDSRAHGRLYFRYITS